MEMAIKATNTITLVQVNDGQDGDPTGVTESTIVPSNPYVGMLWKCTGTPTGYLKNTVYRWNGSKWVIWTFSAVNIIAESFKGLIFTGVTMKASEFVNNWDDEIGSGGGYSHDVGSMEIADHAFRQYNTHYEYKLGTTTEYKRNESSTSIQEAQIQMSMQRYAENGTINENSRIIVEPEYLNIFQEGLNNVQNEMRLQADKIYMRDYKSGFQGTLTAKQIYQLSMVGTRLADHQQGVYMSGNQTVTPSVPLSECLNGWVVEWQGYNNGAPTRGDYGYSYIPKVHSQYHNGLVMSVPVYGHGGGSFRKILYVHDSKLMGHNNNSSAPANTAVLTAVYSY